MNLAASCDVAEQVARLQWLGNLGVQELHRSL
jgi:hypothetical protein